MMLLNAPFDPGRARSIEAPARAGILAAGGILAALALGLGMEAADGALREVGRAIARGAVHGVLLVGGWIVVIRRSDCLWPVLRAAAALLMASVLSAFTTWAALLYLLPPVLLLSDSARHDILRGIGLRAPASLRSLALGFAAGSFLGGHMLLSGSLTIGYLVGVPSIGQYLAAVAYDIGANALSAEWLFRGALFSHWWRRWEFWPAAGVSTFLAALRYVTDPALPSAVEVRAGAIFYTTLLGFAACALRAESGSLLPGYVAAVTFFAAYRMLVP